MAIFALLLFRVALLPLGTWLSTQLKLWTLEEAVLVDASKVTWLLTAPRIEPSLSALTPDALMRATGASSGVTFVFAAPPPPPPQAIKERTSASDAQRRPFSQCNI
ncbi:hypothetical protein AABB87_00445 [Roseateles sp. PN1]